jgi:hypothetical protein
MGARAVETPVGFDYDDVLPTVRRAHPYASHADAEDAVQVAVEEHLKKGVPLTAANVVQRARSRLLSAMKRDARTLSLDAFEEKDVDQAPVELAIYEVDFDSHVRLAEADENPVLAERKRAALAGSSGAIRPRGTYVRASRYTDEQIAEVRRLRKEERLKFIEIEEQTGIERSYAAGLCRGTCRILPSCEGWTDEKMIEAVKIFARREGRAPTYREGQQRQDLPNPSVLFDHGRTWRQLLDEAGVPSTREWRRGAPWSFDEAVKVFREFYEREGRMPRSAELRNPLPSSVTTAKLFGTWSMATVRSIVEGAPPTLASADLCPT